MEQRLATAEGNPHGIQVNFSKPQGASALSAANYSVSGGVTVSSVSPGATMNSVRLNTSGLTAAQMFPFLELLRLSHRDASFATGAWAMPAWGWAGCRASPPAQPSWKRRARRTSTPWRLNRSSG